MTAKSLKHKFVSAIADGSDATLVRPQSNWNDDHNLYYGYRSVTIATDTLADADHLCLVLYNFGSACAVSLPAPTTGPPATFPLGWQCLLRNIGVGTITITPVTTINGTSAPIVLNQGDELDLRGSGTNDYTGFIRPNVKGQGFLSASATATITVGYTFTPNAVGNFPTPWTPNPALGNYQYGTNNAAFQINVPANDCAMDVLITNSATAGAITFGSGWTVGTTGDPFDTTSGHMFILSIRRIHAISTYAIKALQ